MHSTEEELWWQCGLWWLVRWTKLWYCQAPVIMAKNKNMLINHISILDDTNLNSYIDHLFRKRPGAILDDIPHGSCAWPKFNSTCICQDREIFCEFQSLERLPYTLRSGDVQDVILLWVMGWCWWMILILCIHGICYKKFLICLRMYHHHLCMLLIILNFRDLTGNSFPLIDATFFEYLPLDTKTL